jgi:hypothetical protein
MDGIYFSVSFLRSILYHGFDHHLSNTSCSIPTKPVDIYSDPKLDKLLLLVHKYSMELIEKDIIGYLENSKNVCDATSLLVVSQIIKSTSLYEKAKEALIKGEADFTLDNAKRIGTESTYEILMARSKIAKHRPVKCDACISKLGQPTYRVVCEDCGKLHYRWYNY